MRDPGVAWLVILWVYHTVHKNICHYIDKIILRAFVFIEKCGNSMFIILYFMVRTV